MLAEVFESTIDEATKSLTVNVDSGGTSPWMTFALTLLSSVIVFVVSQILIAIWLTPLQKYKEIKQKVSYNLMLYSSCYYNPVITSTGKKASDDYINASNDLREVAAELKGFIEIRPKYHLLIPKKGDLLEASKDLIGLSNGMYAVNSDHLHERIEMNEKLAKSVSDRLSLSKKEK